MSRSADVSISKVIHPPPAVLGNSSDRGVGVGSVTVGAAVGETACVGIGA